MTGTERKALNKYYPPDFDPSKIPRVKGPRNRQYVIRVMAPFNMTCNTCGEYIYKGKKFNARRETVEDDDYLGLFLFRFYIRCPICLAEITFKTDLKNCDYAAEHGSTRLFEADKVFREMEKEKERKEEEDKQDAMKQLEKRTKMSRREMEAIEDLGELITIRHQHKNIPFDSAIALVTEQQRKQLERQEREDEEFVKRCFAKDTTKRPREDVEDEEVSDDDEPGTSSANSGRRSPEVVLAKIPPPAVSKKAKQELNQKQLLAGVVAKKVKATASSTTSFASSAPKPLVSNSASKNDVKSATSSGLNLLGAYGSASDSDEESN